MIRPADGNVAFVNLDGRTERQDKQQPGGQQKQPGRHVGDVEFGPQPGAQTRQRNRANAKPTIVSRWKIASHAKAVLIFRLLPSGHPVNVRADF